MYQLDGILLDTLSRNTWIDGNTISNAQTAITLKNSRFNTISNNTIYNPRTYGIHVEEDGATYIGVVQSNDINNNTILTYNPDYSMVRVEDKVDNIGVLANFSGNKFLNTYKSKLPIIEILAQGGDSKSIDKNNLDLIDAGSSNFTYFGYKTYTSTGSYSGANLITNGTFGANITGWTTDVLSLSYDAAGKTLHTNQGVDATGTLSSNTFNIDAGATYEISGDIKNITNAEGHDIKVRLGNGTGGMLYADRQLDVVATASGTTFKSYVKANASAADAELDFILSNPNSDTEFDNIVVRKVVGLNNNARTNEAILVSNTGSSATTISCASV